MKQLRQISGPGRYAGYHGADLLLLVPAGGDILPAQRGSGGYCAAQQSFAITSWFSAQNFNANIRKWAHVYIYCALGVSMAVTVHLWTRCIALWQQGLLAAALCTLYAMSDEIHQYFVPARAMLLTDVGIDGFGFLPCIAVTCIIIWLLQRRKAEQ